ncbi:MAG: hypothetical protein QXL14_00215 [Candidatus Aenigmatarchaeota archaeon]|nr:hypothetical protein [Methanothermobacter sp.]
MIKASDKLKSANEPVLQFTGNWLIDLGILGFVNLLEEIYNWNLQETQKRIKENEKVVYYGLFPFAYICSEIKRKNSKIPKGLIDDFANEIYKKEFKSEKEIFDFTWENYITKAATELWKKKIIERAINKRKNEKFVKGTPKILKKKIEKVEILGKKIIKENKEEIKKLLEKSGRFQKLEYEDIKSIQSHSKKEFKKYGERFLENAVKLKEIMDDVDEYLSNLWAREVVGNNNILEERLKFYRIPIDNKYYKNFLFFNYSVNHKGQKEKFYYTIASEINREEILINLDKTINKFLESYDKASNIYYTPLKTEYLIDIVPYLFVYLLCFDRAFEDYKNIGHIVFYSNDVFITYEINKRLKLRKSKSEEDLNSIFRDTWQTVIDTIIEMESWWVLENLYLIKYTDLKSDAQRFINVEYMGISRLQATILLDDDIRRNLNQRVQVDKNEYRWLFEEFIKNRPLTSIILDHLILRLNQRTKQRKVQPLLYALALEAELSSEHDFIHLFEDPMSLKLKLDDLVPRIKKSRERMDMARKNIRRLLSEDIRENKVPHLFSIIRRQNKYSFVNSILKLIIANPEKDKKLIKHLNDYIFHQIVQNDKAWIHYALGLFTGFIGG